MKPGPELPPRITFGRFCLFPHRRELLLDNQPIRLGGRAFDVLIALIEARGSVVRKDALMAWAWPDQVVEENNLEVQISALRAAFGAERALIRTVSRRGYQFTGEIRFPAEVKETLVNAGPEAAASATNLPQPVSKLIGRDDSLAGILRLAAAQRFVTLTGPGGIGKTCLALAAAHQLLPRFDGGVWLAELASLSDPDLVPAAVAAAIGLELAAGAVTAERVANALNGKALLLVLDNCEHLIDAAAMMAEALLRANRKGRIIATSREALRAEGEQVYPVPPLAVPKANVDDKTNLLEYGAVRLFVERMRAAEPHFAPDGAPLVTLAAICRRLDGIPLAIELAAARAATLGIEELAVRLDERLTLLTGGRRTALARHQALRATLDWSHGLLAEPERVLFRRLAIFAGWFGPTAACAVAVSAELPASDVIDGISSLAAKSLVAAEVRGVARYRLLDTTRAYALEKLSESGEREWIARCHATYYRDLFEQAEAEWKVRTTSEWIGEYGWRIDNLRAALDWAFSAYGDATLGVALTVAAIPLWMHLSLLEECRGHLEKALAALRPGANRDARREMKLHAALAASLRYTRGAVSETGAAWTKALEIAESLDDPEYQLRALWGLWFFHTTSSRHRVALDVAQRLCTLAERWPDPNDRLIGERAMSISQHYLGDQSSARRHIERVLADYVIADARPHLIRFQIDLQVMTRVFFARVLWLQGLPVEAMQAAERSVEDARAANHAISLCYALFLGACPIALSVGDLVAAEHYVSMLLDQSTRFTLTFWAARGRSYQGALVIKRGDGDTGLTLLRAGFDELGEARSAVLGPIELLMPEALGRAGQIVEGLAAIDEAINHSETTEERWMIAEMLRIKGELLLLQGGPTAAAAAEDHFRRSLDSAARQGALSLELRAATSLARLLRDQGDYAEAFALLQPVYDRFTEGFATADLRAAKALLDDLREFEEVEAT
jgi:predicted ATPase/DNA-binding winged helix-turn-helix (wHTH) protein